MYEWLLGAGEGSVNWVAGMGVVDDYKGSWKNFLRGVVIEPFSILMAVAATQLYAFVKTHRTVHWKGWIFLYVSYASVDLFFFFNFIYLLLAALGLRYCTRTLRRAGATLRCSACAGVSWRRLLLLQSTGSVSKQRKRAWLSAPRKKIAIVSFSLKC